MRFDVDTRFLLSGAVGLRFHGPIKSSVAVCILALAAHVWCVGAIYRFAPHVIQGVYLGFCFNYIYLYFLFVSSAFFEG